MWKAGICLSIALGVTRLNCALASPLPFDPVPVPNLVAVFALGIPTFDPATHAYSFSGPITVVQLPGENLTDTDPLVLAGGVLTEFGTFTGAAITPFASLTTTGEFLDYTVQLSVHGQLIFSETYGRMVLDAIYDTPRTHIADWRGDLVGPKFVDYSVVDSPFLHFFAGYSENGTKTLVYDDGDGIKGSNDDAPTPEPGTLLVLVIPMIGLIALRRRRKPIA